MANINHDGINFDSLPQNAKNNFPIHFNHHPDECAFFKVGDFIVLIFLSEEIAIWNGITWIK